MKPSPSDQLAAAFKTCVALGQAIEELGPMGVGAGTLYAGVMGVMSQPTFDGAIRALENAGAIVRRGHQLISTKFIQAESQAAGEKVT